MNMTMTRLIAARVRRDAIAAERNVKVIAQESGKRDVPASPEIREADRGVGKPEIILEMKAEAQCRADRADGIAGEIEKDLAGKCDHARPGIERDERTAITEDRDRPNRRAWCRRALLFRIGRASSSSKSPEELADAQARRP